MVRLVFHPYTQVCWSICTSGSLWASTRVSSGFSLLKHSSPSFGFQQVCSYSNASRSRIGRSVMRSSLRGYLTSVASSLYVHCACRWVKISRSRWVAWNHMTINNFGTVCVLFPSTACLSSSALRTRSKSKWRDQPKRVCVGTPLLDLSLHTISYNTSWNQLPSCRAYHSAPTAVDTHCWGIWQFWSKDIHRRSTRIRTVHVTKQNCLNLSNALLIPCASLQTVSRTINFHFKVLFIFPWQYLFSIGLVPIFSFRSLPPILGCISKQPNS